MKPSIVAGALALALSPGAASAEPVERAKVEAALPQIEAMAAKLVADGAVPGIAIVVVHADEVVYLGGFGLREVGKPETVDADTVFQLASMSKPISATVVAKLVSDGVLGWDSRIADLNPAFQLHDPFPTAEVTVTDLLNHRSGLPGTSGDDLEAIGFDRETIAARLRLVPPSSSFRAGYAYSNAGFTQGALAAAMPTGQSWEKVAEERLYRPLGMAATSSRHSDFVARPNRATLHVPSQGGWAALATREPDAQAPAGGVSASVRDLAQWLRLELGTGDWEGAPFIDPGALAATHEPLFAAAPTRSAAPPPSTAAAGTRSSAATAGPGAMPAPSAPGRAPSSRSTPTPGSASSSSPTPSRPGCRRASPTASSTSSSTAASRRTGWRTGTGCTPVCSARRSRRPERPTPARRSRRPRRCRPRATSAATATTTSARRR